MYNSAFIRDVLGSHELILHLATVIRYWASRQNINGPYQGSINNYALTMLVIFFLQAECVLPPIKKFQENLMEEENILIDGWQFGYNKEVVQNVKDDITQRFEKNWSWKDWLCRFFTFYLKFDYENGVISPYAGRTIPRKRFESLALSLTEVKGQRIEGSVSIPDSDVEENLLNYWKNVKDGEINLLSMTNQVCVQDPFEQNFCVSRGVSKIKVLQWRNCCMCALECLQQQESQKSGILCIFEKTIEFPKNRAEQRDISNKIESLYGVKVPVHFGKRPKTRTGKLKKTNDPNTSDAK